MPNVAVQKIDEEALKTRPKEALRSVLSVRPDLILLHLSLPDVGPPEVDFRPLDPSSYRIGLPGCKPTRVTTDAGVFEFSSDNFQLFSPGGDAFGAFYVDCTGGSAEGRGIAWIIQRPGAEAEFVVATRFGPRTAGSFEELLAALDVVGEPSEFPYADWPGVTVSAIA